MKFTTLFFIIQMFPHSLQQDSNLQLNHYEWHVLPLNYEAPGRWDSNPCCNFLTNLISNETPSTTQPLPFTSPIKPKDLKPTIFENYDPIFDINNFSLTVCLNNKPTFSLLGNKQLPPISLFLLPSFVD